MDTGILHSHTLVASLYALLICLLSFFVITRNKNTFTTLRLKLKWPRMVLEILMLLTGIYLVFKAPDGQSVTYIIKYAATVAAVVFAVIGFKRFQPLLTTLSVIMLIFVYFSSKTHSWQLRPDSSRSAEVKVNTGDMSPAAQTSLGKELYQINCQRCHGTDGQAGYRKARNIITSQKGDAYADHLMQNGLNAMPAFSHLDASQRGAIIAYINSMKGEQQASVQ